MKNLSDNLSINKALALTIGWQETDFFINPEGELFICVPEEKIEKSKKVKPRSFKRFCFNLPSVIFPIAEELNLFPSKCNGGIWRNEKLSVEDSNCRLVIALSVIKKFSSNNQTKKVIK